MKVWQIVLIIVVFISIVIAGILIFQNGNSDFKKGPILQPIYSGEVQTFKATVIANDETSITVVPDENELVSQSFKIVKTAITKNTEILLNEQNISADVIKVEDRVQITFDGSIYEIAPALISASKIIIIE